MIEQAVDDLYKGLDEMHPVYPGTQISLAYYAKHTGFEDIPRVIVRDTDSPEIIVKRLKTMMATPTGKTENRLKGMKKYLEAMDDIVFKYCFTGMHCQLCGLGLAARYIGDRNWRVYADKAREEPQYGDQIMRDLTEQFGPHIFHEMGKIDPVFVKVLTETESRASADMMGFVLALNLPAHIREGLNSSNLMRFRKDVEALRKQSGP